MEMMEFYGKFSDLFRIWLDLFFPHLFSDPEDFPIGKEILEVFRMVPRRNLHKQNRQNVHSESQTHKKCVWLFRFGKSNDKQL